MRISAQVTRGQKVLKEVAFKPKRKGDVKRAVAKLVRRFRKNGRGKLFAKGTSIAVVKRSKSRKRQAA